MAHPVVNIAVKAARRAGSLMRRYLDQVDSVPVTRKARHDYVSEIDHACEQEIVREIRRVHPDHAFLGEEGGQQGDGDVVWVIDPIDGTSNYLHGYPHFAVSIAQQVGGRTEHGVVYDPIREELFTASRGKGAYLNDRRIRVSERKGLEGAILATAFPFRDRDVLPNYRRVFDALFDQIEDIRRAGTASLDLAWVAAGRLDGYFEWGLQPWDMAAGNLLVREAGGAVSDFFGDDTPEDKGSIVAAPFKIMTPLRQAISSHWKG